MPVVIGVIDVSALIEYPVENLPGVRIISVAPSDRIRDIWSLYLLEDQVAFGFEVKSKFSRDFELI